MTTSTDQKSDTIPDLIAELIRPRNYTANIHLDDGTKTTHATHHPPLLDELESNTTTAKVGVEKHHGDPRSKPAGRLDAVALLYRIDREADAIATTIGLTESEAKSRRYDDAKEMAISKAESLIEEMCADTALPTFSLGMYDNALAAMDGQGALQVSLCGFRGTGVNKLHMLAEGIQARLDAMCPEIGWEIIRRTDCSVGTIAVLRLQLHHTKPYIEEDA